MLICIYVFLTMHSICFLVEGTVALAEVTLEMTLHHLALSCDELTLSVCGVSEVSGLSLTFYDVRTFINKVSKLSQFTECSSVFDRHCVFKTCHILYDPHRHFMIDLPV